MMTHKEYMRAGEGLEGLSRAIATHKAHRAYYGQFLNEGLCNRIAKEIGQDRLRNSRDWAFNDIPLRDWDRLAYLVSFLEPQVREAGGTFPLSVITCLLKEGGRLWLERVHGSKEYPVSFSMEGLTFKDRRYGTAVGRSMEEALENWKSHNEPPTYHSPCIYNPEHLEALSDD